MADTEKVRLKRERIEAAVVMAGLDQIIEARQDEIKELERILADEKRDQ